MGNTGKVRGHSRGYERSDIIHDVLCGLEVNLRHNHSLVLHKRRGQDCLLREIMIYQNYQLVVLYDSNVDGERAVSELYLLDFCSGDS